MGPRLAALLLGLLVAAMQIPAAEPLPDERTSAYRDFRTNFDADRYTEALPYAIEVLRLTEAQHGTEARELVNPLTNLATTHYRLGQFDAALDQYQRALAILDSVAANNDVQLIRPLHGIGATYQALKRDEEAATALKRAVDISRNRDGLFNAAQLEVLRPLIAAYMRLGRLEEAGTEQQYAYTIAESAYGANDLRLLGPLDELARWNEATGHYAAARQLHARAVQLAEKARGSNTPLAVAGLRGIARTYRLGWINGEEAPEPPAGTTTPLVDVPPSGMTVSQLGPNQDGERALRAALGILQREKPVDNAACGAVLTDLGDWYQTVGAEVRAAGAWREAWKCLAAAGNTATLANPVLVVYRAPSIAVSRRKEDPKDYDQRDVKISLTVTADGQTENVLSNVGEGTESAARLVVTAIKRARYRPRFVDGEPVVTRDVEYTERVFVKRR